MANRPDVDSTAHDGHSTHFDLCGTVLGADAIVTRGVGDWSAVEVRLGGVAAVETAIASLRRLRAAVDTQRAGESSRLIVVTATSRAFETNEDIAVVPLAQLRP